MLASKLKLRLTGLGSHRWLNRMKEAAKELLL